MFDRLLALFADPGDPPADPAAAARVAAAAVLVEAARSDGDYAAEEVVVIDRALAQQFSLDAAAAAALRREGEEAQDAAVGQQRFTQALKDGLTLEERTAFLTEVWRVVLADGRRDDHENAFMRKLAGLLYVPDVDSNHARRRAEGG